MKMLNGKELNLVNAGFICHNPPTHEARMEELEKQRHKKWLKWVNQEKQKLEDTADIRICAAENALKAAMRLDRAEMECKSQAFFYTMW